MDQTTHHELTPEQREAVRSLAEMPPAPPAWTLYALPGETRQQARARWRRANKEARYSASVKREQIDRSHGWRNRAQKPARSRVAANGVAEARRIAARLMAAALSGLSGVTRVKRPF